MIRVKNKSEDPDGPTGGGWADLAAVAMLLNDVPGLVVGCHAMFGTPDMEPVLYSLLSHLSALNCDDNGSLQLHTSFAALQDFGVPAGSRALVAGDDVWHQGVHQGL